jgi:DNA-binding XRE family transcriptional regulator
MESGFIIYGLYCPITKKPVYIGMSTTGIDRPFQHIKEKSHSSKVNEWVSNLKKDGMSPILVILDTSESEEIIKEKETFWIQKMIIEGNILLNQSKVKPIYFESLIYNRPEIGNNNLEDVGLFIKHRRRMLDLTQVELAKKAGVGLRFVRDLEQNTKDNFNTKSINKILRLFGAKLTVCKI